MPPAAATAPLPPDRALSLRAVAERLGCSPATVLRLERRALAKIAAAADTGEYGPGRKSDVASDLPQERITHRWQDMARRYRELRYLQRLMSCPWGEYPDADPPP